MSKSAITYIVRLTHRCFRVFLSGICVQVVQLQLHIPLKGFCRRGVFGRCVLRSPRIGPVGPPFCGAIRDAKGCRLRRLYQQGCQGSMRSPKDSTGFPKVHALKNFKQHFGHLWILEHQVVCPKKDMVVLENWLEIEAGSIHIPNSQSANDCWCGWELCGEGYAVNPIEPQTLNEQLNTIKLFRSVQNIITKQLVFALSAWGPRSRPGADRTSVQSTGGLRVSSLVGSLAELQPSGAATRGLATATTRCLPAFRTSNRNSP